MTNLEELFAGSNPTLADSDADGLDDDDEISDENDNDDYDEEDSASFSTTASETGKSLALIESLLSNKDISDSLRDELQGYKEDIGENDFTESDAAYVATLAARLNKGGDV